MRQLWISLLVYTILALAVESAFTGFADLYRRVRSKLPIDRKLPCRTSLWGIGVYGVSAAVGFAVMDAVFPAFFDRHWLWRGAFYVVGIYFWEFVWGWALETTLGTCPWQYRHSTWRVWRYIKPRFAGYWFAFGFVLEWAHLRAIPLFVAALGSGP
jgi:hypothetical protein